MLPPIIPPVDVELLKSELNEQTFLRTTNRGNNELYVAHFKRLSLSPIIKSVSLMINME